MLPYVKTVKSSAIALMLAILTAVPSAPAFAWGQREQDVLKGVLGTLAVTAIIREANKNRTPAPKYYYLEPVPRSGYGTGHGYDKPRTSHNTLHNTAAAQAFNSYSRSERQAIQRQLSYHGYYSGRIDGSFGPGTYRAIAAYSRDTGNFDRLASRNGAFAIYDGLIF